MLHIRSEEFVQSESQLYPEGPWFARTGTKVYIHTYVSLFVSWQGAPPLFEACSAQPPSSLFQPLRAPSFQARIIAITMNSSSYYASVVPPRKWRPGASYRATRTRSVWPHPRFARAPVLPACRSTAYASRQLAWRMVASFSRRVSSPASF